LLLDAAQEALDEVERVEAKLSHYRPDSEISDLNLRAAYEPVLVDPALAELLGRALALAEATDGAFDPTAGPLVKCWGFFRGEGRLPDAEAVAAARERVGWRLVEMDSAGRTVRFRREGVEVHLGAIGKGYAIDRAAEVLREVGIGAALLHGGTSTVCALGAPPGADAWRVGLRHPADPERRIAVVRLRNRALSTSGDYEQFFEAEGHRWGHILDPRTGEPARGVRSATILGDSATDTDALSTAAFVLGVEGARGLCERFPGTGAVVVPDAGGDTIEPAVFGWVEIAPGERRGEEEEP
jgi:thiamine biosynthesis lipoprotein